MAKQKEKQLTPKQLKALELLTCGEGLTYKEIAERVECDTKALYNWRTQPEFAHFQEALKRINDERWLATVDIARAAAAKLCARGNAKMVEFILKNEGYNPVQNVKAEIDTDINIEIGE